MDTTARHKMWEVYLTGHPYPLIASQVLTKISDGISLHDIARLKRLTAESENDGEVFIRCSECNCPLFTRASSTDDKSPHFVHNRHLAPSLESMLACSFYKGINSTLFSQIYRGEGLWHFETKSELIRILNSSSKVIPESVDSGKYIFKSDHELNVRRKPDVQFTDISGNQWVIELARWWLSPKTVVEREHFFRDKGINLLWLFSPACRQKNQGTYELIMYGSNFEETSYQGQTRPQNNAFTISNRALDACRTHSTLMFDTHYPEYQFNENTKKIESVNHHELVEFTELILSPYEHLPYAYETSKSLAEAKAKLRQANRGVLAGVIRQVRFEYFSVFSEKPNAGWSINFSYKNFNDWRLAIGDEYLNTNRIGQMLVKLERYYRNEERKKLACNIRIIRDYAWRIKTNGRKPTNKQVTECLANNILYKLPNNYPYQNAIFKLNDHLLTFTENQGNRQFIAGGINSLRHDINALRTEIKFSLNQGVARIDNIVQKLEDLSAECPLKDYSIRLTNRINSTLLYAQAIKSHRHRLAREEALEKIKQNKQILDRIESETLELLDFIKSNGLQEFPFNASTIVIRYNRLRRDCKAHQLTSQWNALDSAYNSALNDYKFKTMKTMWPLLSQGWSDTVNFDCELGKLFSYLQLRFHLKTPQHQEGAQYQLWSKQLILHFIETLNAELEQLYTIAQYSRHDQLISIRRNDAIFARRVKYTYKLIIERDKSIVNEAIYGKLSWLKCLLGELTANPNLSRLR
ncbi:hypothetical protein ACVBIO_01110 [Shewanella sp. 0m-8]